MDERKSRFEKINNNIAEKPDSNDIICLYFPERVRGKIGEESNPCGSDNAPTCQKHFDACGSALIVETEKP